MIITITPTRKRPVPKRGPTQRIVEARSPQQIIKERGRELREYRKVERPKSVAVELKALLTESLG